MGLFCCILLLWGIWGIEPPCLPMILTLGKADESNGDDGRMDEGCREDDVDERELSLIEVAMSSIIAMQLLLLGAISFLLDVVWA